jgi:hypothetical protein
MWELLEREKERWKLWLDSEDAYDKYTNDVTEVCYVRLSMLYVKNYNINMTISVNVSFRIKASGQYNC